MPKTKKEDLPATVQRSPKKAQKTFAKALDSAHEQYRSEERAHRTAYSALKHSFEKVGDRWEKKERTGPSDPQAKQRGRAARHSAKGTAGGVDAWGNTKAELYERAKRAGVRGRSRMKKAELARAVARKQG